MRRPVQSACLALMALGFVCPVAVFAQTSSPPAASAPAAGDSSKLSSAASTSSAQTQLQPQSHTESQSPAGSLKVLPGAELPPLKPPPPVRVQVTLPAGTHIAVVLDTPVSTRISHNGQLINFRTSEPLYLDGKLVLPSDSVLNGKVTDVHKPGLFTSSGNVRMAVDSIEEPDGSALPLAAKLDASDPQASGKGKSDKTKSAAILSAVILAGEGALIGASIGGAKGAGIGAGAGTAIALGGMMVKHGQDVYLEPGTPFLVTLNQPIQMWAIIPQVDPVATGVAPGSAKSPPGDPRTDPDRPQLERRPKPIAPPQAPPLN
jgi:hypothetical protein